jgi:hypothetical protein
MFDSVLVYVYNCYNVRCLSSTPNTPAQGWVGPTSTGSTYSAWLLVAYKTRKKKGRPFPATVL